MNAVAAHRPQPARARAGAGLRVRLLGVGALGGTLAGLLRAGDVAGCSLAGVVRSTTAGRPAELLRGTEVLVEAAGAEAARAWVPRAVEAGVDVVLCSCGVLADPEFTRDLPEGPGRVLVPSGAIGGLDLFAAAARALDGRPEGPPASVVLTTTKRPAALGVEADRPVEVFRGSARAAALAHPKTANVAVALALATLGLDGVTVVMVADPAAAMTRHVVTMASPLGDYELSVANAVAPGSGGRTSAVTPWSVVTLLESLAAGHGAGLLVAPRRGTDSRHDTEDRT
ncbi:aspartate dehydrogenase [Actinocorallia herbida]|uniref:Aspartate dehydrogenase n=1 Tax=Actinocorallia herbida TaxID=58109 RepID=A0A3N1CZD8_9ACTN|nr:aspartate dehydrogenase domain-containing protein [Actinocorallia herbida]ROO86650.1 aspartate dehydrogenase [Actinocorallia herbida]